MFNFWEPSLIIIQSSMAYLRIIMKRFLMFLVGLMFLGCSQSTQVEVGLNWSKDGYATLQGNWLLGVIDGEHINDWTIKGLPIHLVPVTSGENIIERFLLPDENHIQLTAFVFCDVNNNMTFEDGEDIITGFKPGARNSNDEFYLQIGAWY